MEFEEIPVCFPARVRALRQPLSVRSRTARLTDKRQVLTMSKDLNERRALAHAWLIANLTHTQINPEQMPLYIFKHTCPFFQGARTKAYTRVFVCVRVCVPPAKLCQAAQNLAVVLLSLRKEKCQTTFKVLSYFICL